MVEVDALMVGLALAGHNAVGDAAGYPVGAGGHDVADRRAAPAGVPAAFQLMGSHCAAPQKVFRKHMGLLIAMKVLHLKCLDAVTAIMTGRKVKGVQLMKLSTE